MPATPEDQTDISGVPQSQAQGMTPAEMAKSMHARTAAGHMKNPLQGAEQKVGQALQGAKQKEASVLPQHGAQDFGGFTHQLGQLGHFASGAGWSQRPMQGPHNNPLLARMANDGWYAYELGHHLFGSLNALQQDTGSYASQSIQRLWQKDAALMEFNQYGTPIAPFMIGLYNLGNLLQGGPGKMMGGLREDVPVGLSNSQQRQYEQSMAVGGGMVASQLVNPATYLSMVAPEGLAAKGAFGAYGALSSLLSAQNVSPGNIFWAAVSGLLWSQAPLPQPLKDGVKSVLGEALNPAWDTFQNHLLSKMYEQGETARLMRTPDGRNKIFNDMLQHIADREGTKAITHIVLPASEMGKTTGTFTRDLETGEISMSTAADAQRLRKNLEKVGASSMDDLIERLQGTSPQGPLSTTETKRLIKMMKNGVLKMPYDLVMQGAEDTMPLPDENTFATHMENMIEEGRGSLVEAARNAHTALKAYVDHMMSGPLRNGDDPVLSTLRSLGGMHTGTNYIQDRLEGHWIELLGKKGAADEALQHRLFQAVEGKEEGVKAYESLTPEQKFVVDQMRVWNASEKVANRLAGRKVGEIPDYMPRIPEQFKDETEEHAKVTGPLTGKKLRQRELRASLDIFHPGEDPQSNVLDKELQKEGIVLRQAYDTVGEANQAIERQRAQWVKDVMSKGSASRIENPTLVRALRSQGASQEEVEAAAERQFRKFDTNALRVMHRTMGRRIAALHSYEAATWLTNTIGKTVLKDGTTRELAVRYGKSDRTVQELRNLGYGESKSAWYRNTLFHPEVMKAFDRYEQDLQQAYTRSGLLGVLQKFENSMVKLIMYSPMMHGLNMASRMAISVGMHPMLWAKWFTRDGKSWAPDGILGVLGQSDHGRDIESLRMTMAGLKQGVRLPTARNPGAEFLRQISSATGDSAIAVQPYVTNADSVDQTLLQKGLDKLAKLGEPISSAWDFYNNMLWNRVRDFGTAVYHIEREAKLNAGWSPGDATQWAVRRANTFMGVVSPEDIRHPMLHSMARLLMFAPNWWRTWGELLSGYYRDSGINWSPQRIAMQIANDLRIGAVAVGWQKLSGEVLNYALSGHWQNQNLLGNQDKIEIQREDILALLMKIDPGLLGDAKTGYIDPRTGVNPNTGAVLTIENPMARQQLASETGLGYESGQSGHTMFKLGSQTVDAPPSLKTAFEGLSKEAAARLSPLLDSAAGMGNIDLYNTLGSGIWTGNIDYLDPAMEAGASPTSLVMNMLASLPGGSNVNYQMQRNIEQQMAGPYQTTIPKAVSDALQGTPQTALTQILAGLTGVNPPYAAAQRTPAQSAPTNAQYQQIDQDNKNYTKSMDTLAAQLSSGQITPSQWLQDYQQLAAQHANQMNAYFQGSSSYANGTQGLLNRYYALQASPTVMSGPGGTFNADAWLEAKTKFLNSLPAAQRNALESEIVKNQERYPVVSIYEGSVKQYEAFQVEWSQENGVNVNQLRREAIAYGRLYGDRMRAQQYLGSHPELQAWEGAKRMWELTPQGITYGLFEGSSTAYMAALNPVLIQQGQAEAQRAQGRVA